MIFGERGEARFRSAPGATAVSLLELEKEGAIVADPEKTAAMPAERVGCEQPFKASAIGVAALQPLHGTWRFA